MRGALSLRAVLAAAALALSACGDPTGPSLPLAETYVLTRVDGVEAPLVIASQLLGSGERQVYTLTFDTMHFSSDTAGTRRFELRVETFLNDRPTTPPLRTRFEYATEVVRRGSRVVVHYTGPSGRPVLAPDTFTVRGPDLRRLGPLGLVCDGCPPPRRVEYLYQPT